MTDQQRVEHNKLFEEASALIKDEIPLHDRPPLPPPGWFLRRRLKRALSLFERILGLAPENWSAMWLVGNLDIATKLGCLDEEGLTEMRRGPLVIPLPLLYPLLGTSLAHPHG